MLTCILQQIPDDLTESKQDSLLDVYDEISQVEFPPLFEQYTRLTSGSDLNDNQIERLEQAYSGKEDKLGEGFEPRETIDHAILEVLGFENPDDITTRLYSNLLDELVTLKLMMG